ncbi:MAG: flagellar FlbD family protein [Firmicutes bacterium]|jgi:flagellar protein FlbD|nr:flagellar FlbD family protein [Bacillota bacterium]
MIRVHRLDGKDYYLNANLIETVEAVPDTLITLTTGRRLFVQESVAEVVRLATDFFARVANHEWIGREP